MKATGKGMKATGKGMQKAGEGMQKGGEAIEQGSQALGEGLAAIPYVGPALGGAVTGAGTVLGKGTQAAGVATEGAGKATETAGKATEKAGEAAEKQGQQMQRSAKSRSSGITGKKKSKKDKAKEEARRKFILANLGPILLIVAILIFIIFLVGIILFFITMPGLMLGKIDDWGRAILGNIQGIFTGDSTTVQIKSEDIIGLAEHLGQMGYDVQAYGLGTVKYKDKETIDRKNGKAKEIEEITKNVEGKEYLRSYIAANENTYVLSQYSILGALTSDVHNIGEIFSFDKDKDFTNASDYSTGMIDIIGDSSGSWFKQSNSSFAEINRDSKQLKLYSQAIQLGPIAGTVKRIFTGNPNIQWGETFSYDLNNWVGRYGRPTELFLALHLSTMMPDLPYEIATNKDFNTKVNIGLMDTNVSYSVTAVKEDSTITGEEIVDYYNKYCTNSIVNDNDLIPNTIWTKKEIEELKDIVEDGSGDTSAGPVDMEHARVCGDYIWDSYNSNIRWHGNDHPYSGGDIGAYTEAIDILWNKDYRIRDVYEKLVEFNPELKESSKLFFFDSKEANQYYSIETEKVNRKFENIKQALSEGKLAAAISNSGTEPGRFRNNNGELQSWWTGAHWGLIFLFDGTYYHMKVAGSGHSSDALYTEEQLKEWLDLDGGMGSDWGAIYTFARANNGLAIKWPFIASVKQHWFYEDIDFTKDVYRFAKSATKQIDYKPENKEDILNKNNVSVKLNATLSSNQGIIYQVAEPEATGPNEAIKKLFLEGQYYKYDGTLDTAEKIENAKAVENNKKTFKFNGEEIPSDKSSSKDVKREKVNFKENKTEAIAAFGILENMHTEASEYIYRNLKELMTELKYFSTQELTEDLQRMLLWPVRTENQNTIWKLSKDERKFGTRIECEDNEKTIVAPSEARIDKIEGTSITLEFINMSDKSYELLEYIFDSKDPYKKVNKELVTGMKLKIENIMVNESLNDGSIVNRGDTIGVAVTEDNSKPAIIMTMYNLDKSIVEDLNMYFDQGENTKYEELMRTRKDVKYDEGLDITGFLLNNTGDLQSVGKIYHQVSTPDSLAEGNKLVEAAKSQLGVKYWSVHYGPKGDPFGNGEGFGCAMFVSYAYNTVYFNGHRGDDASEGKQRKSWFVGWTQCYWSNVAKDDYGGTNMPFVEVYPEDAQPGDVICYVDRVEDQYSTGNNCHHVAMYVGNSQEINGGGGSIHPIDMNDGVKHFLHFVGSEGMKSSIIGLANENTIKNSK